MSESEKLFTVLIIEDNDDMRFLMDTCLNPYYKTIQAINGVEGFELAREFMPDLILTDVMMENGDGMEFCKKIKATIETAHIPVIMITAKAMEEDQLAGYASGAVDYIIKPFNVAILLLKVKNIVEANNLLKTKFKIDNDNFENVANNEMDNKLLKLVKVYIIENYQDPEFGVESLASHMGMSKSTFYRKLKAITGKSAVELIQDFRMQMAHKLLKTSGKNISEVAYEVGYTDPGYFSIRFKECFGIAPSDLNSLR